MMVLDYIIRNVLNMSGLYNPECISTEAEDLFWKNHAWMRHLVKPLDVSICYLHTMNCSLSQLLRCQRIIKCTLKAVCDLRQVNINRFTLNGMSRYGLNKPKLAKHPLRATCTWYLQSRSVWCGPPG
jgi:hypothetical protein